jgi:hypothetical protein
VKCPTLVHAAVCAWISVAVLACGPGDPISTAPKAEKKASRAAETAKAEKPDPTPPALDPRVAAALDAIRDRQKCNRIMGCKPSLELLQRGPDATLPILLAVTRSGSDGYWKIRLVEVLGQLGDPRAIPSLERLLSSSQWEIRCRSAIALARLGSKGSAVHLERMIAERADPDDPVSRVAALVALDRLGLPFGDAPARTHLLGALPLDEETLGPLNPGYYAFLAESIREARLTSALALARLGARHRDRFVREASLKTLGALQDTGGISVTVGRLDDPLPSIKRLAVTTLQQITGSHTLTDADQWKSWCEARACRGPRAAPLK